MTPGAKTGTPKPQSALVLAFAIIALLGGEIFWLYRWHQANESLYVRNVRQAGQNYLDQRKVTDLKAAAVKIDSLYLRLQDPVLPPKNGQKLPPLNRGRAGQTGQEPVEIQDFVKAGFAALPGRPRRHGEASVVYELASDRLEFHRLVPLLAQEENSNVFLFLDHAELKRPAGTEPFSMHPSALEFHARVRMFTSAAQ